VAEANERVSDNAFELRIEKSYRATEATVTMEFLPNGLAFTRERPSAADRALQRLYDSRAGPGRDGALFPSTDGRGGPERAPSI
jgi:hypothetical protein